MGRVVFSLCNLDRAPRRGGQRKGNKEPPEEWLITAPHFVFTVSFDEIKLSGMRFLFLVMCVQMATAWLLPFHGRVMFRSSEFRVVQTSDVPIHSPFTTHNINDNDDEGGDETNVAPSVSVSHHQLPLTLENVEIILDEMRPFLVADGGNVAVSGIDGAVVFLELTGACGSCASSTVTMKMGLEKRLKEAIPDIKDVVQSRPETPELTLSEIDLVLDEIRPFLAVGGGKIEVTNLSGVGSLQPQIRLRTEGASASIQSVKLEIMQRIQQHFMMSGLRIDWEDKRKAW
jgi:Fe-S cluster biogenesis protein NfuA